MLTTPILAAVAGVAGVAAVAAALLRRVVLPRGAMLLVAGGLFALALAAGGMRWRRPVAREVAVLVDLSASTRTASYRNRGALEARVRELLGPQAAYHFLYFAEEPGLTDAGGTRLADLPSRRTLFPAVSAAATLVFTDGRFDVPPAPLSTAYVVVDPGLESPVDAAVKSVEIDGAETTIRLRNSGGPRALTLSGAASGGPTIAATGAYTLTRPLAAGASGVAAALAPADAWPENDAMSCPLPPPRQAERWVVTDADTALPPGWRRVSPAALPTDAAAYLTPAVIVLQNVPASMLESVRQDRLRQYVRDLGGGLIILGGDRAFAAGGYTGTVLESLSPLASTPPQPTTQWIILADASGSMNESAGDANASATRWRYAVDAIGRVIPTLPPEDLITVGSFNVAARWWITARPVKEAAALPLPPAGVAPRGATNLRPVLERLVSNADAALPKPLLLLTDADADLGDTRSLIAAMQQKQIRLYLLALGDGRGLAALREIAAATGGQVVRQDAAGAWSAALRELAQGAGPKRLEASPLAIRFIGELTELGLRSASPWNRTWLQPGATPAAQGAFGGGASRSGGAMECG